jgi:hypothetical protein
MRMASQLPREHLSIERIFRSHDPFRNLPLAGLLLRSMPPFWRTVETIWAICELPTAKTVRFNTFLNEQKTFFR